MNYNKLDLYFYQRNDTLKICKDLLGKVLVTNINNNITSGRIVEVEAYLGANDKASHSYNNKKTQRTEVMFLNGGISYVYLCYGIHYLFNIVVGKKNNPCAILIRAIQPFKGINIMLQRRNLSNATKNLTNGPGKLAQALGITTKLNKQLLINNMIWVEDHEIKLEKKDILSSPRIGVDYAGDDSKLPYRFYIKKNKWVSN